VGMLADLGIDSQARALSMRCDRGTGRAPERATSRRAAGQNANDGCEELLDLMPARLPRPRGRSRSELSASAPMNTCCESSAFEVSKFCVSFHFTPAFVAASGSMRLSA